MLKQIRDDLAEAEAELAENNICRCIANLEEVKISAEKAIRELRKIKHKEGK